MLNSRLMQDGLILCVIISFQHMLFGFDLYVHLGWNRNYRLGAF